MQGYFSPLAQAFTAGETAMVQELDTIQGHSVDQYLPDIDKIDAVMRPSATFNAALAATGS